MSSSSSSSEEEDDFPCIESVTPQSKIDTIYQSKTEKGIRKLCFELLDLKDAVENLCSNTRTKYLAFLRLSEEVVETEHELNELRKNISTQRILVQDLLSGVYHELSEWSRANPDLMNPEQLKKEDKNGILVSNKAEDEIKSHLANLDVLLAEHKVEEAINAIEAIEAEERKHQLSNEFSSSFKSAFLKQKTLLESQLVEMTDQTLISATELKTVVNGLVKLGKGHLAHQLFLKAKGARLQKNINLFLSSCACYPETFPATLSNLIFSTILSTTNEMSSVFGDDMVYSNKAVQWAEWQIELFVRVVKENAPSSETVSALHAASVCVQASLNHCSGLESQGLKLSKVLLVLLQPYIEEVLELNFRRARKLVFDFSGIDEIMPLSPRLASPLSTFAISSDGLLVDSGTRFIFMVKDIVDQLTRLVILHFGGNVLTRILQLFDQYIDELIKALPEPSEDDSLVELKESVPFRAETDSQQLALLGTAFTIAEELLPMVMSKIWSILNESKEAAANDNSVVAPLANNMIDYKDWRKQLQYSLDKLRDHFCRQYVLNFIYSRDGKTRPDANIYLSGESDDLNWNSDPLPSLPFQALFGKLQQLATVAGDVLLGKEKIQKVLLARLTETVVLWLMSNDEDFWGVLENQVSNLQPQGLQQLILDMHFTVEIARFAGYPSRNVQQTASSIIARAIRTFSGRGLNQQSVLPEDEWFVETAKAAINKLLGGDEVSEGSEIDEDHIILHDDDDDDEDDDILHDEVISDSEGSPSSLSTITTSESFASAESQMLDSLSDFADDS
ncbi:exocyst complex component EXO84C-like [Bidens hawaiensis]|uniref:exocyst complex component EXO84C-like n=1 Tax=Bidens hawaiensis TaxID=980011 RepID=UPI004049181E